MRRRCKPCRLDLDDAITSTGCTPLAGMYPADPCASTTALGSVIPGPVGLLHEARDVQRLRVR